MPSCLGNTLETSVLPPELFLKLLHLLLQMLDGAKLLGLAPELLLEVRHLAHHICDLRLEHAHLALRTNTRPHLRGGKSGCEQQGGLPSGGTHVAEPASRRRHACVK